MLTVYPLALSPSLSLMSSVGLTPPLDIWAGKSRNAKAQARHRAKRKAYIEQLEQTVSKLQTALALSTEDVSNLPTTQVKLRELKEENESLRAELRKLQLQQAANFSISSVMTPQNAMPSEEQRRPPKRRRVSSSGENELRYTYLDSVGPGIEPATHKLVPSSNHLIPPSPSVQSRGYHLQGPGGMTIPETSQSTPLLRDEQSPWTSYIPTPPQADSPPSWGHARNRSTSSISSASSEAAPTPYLIPNHFHESPYLRNCDISPPIQMNAIGKQEKDEMLSYYDSNSGASAKRTQVNTHAPLSISTNGPWSDLQIWPYSTVRAF